MQLRRGAETGQQQTDRATGQQKRKRYAAAVSSPRFRPRGLVQWCIWQCYHLPAAITAGTRLQLTTSHAGPATNVSLTGLKYTRWEHFLFLSLFRLRTVVREKFMTSVVMYHQTGSHFSRHHPKSRLTTKGMPCPLFQQWCSGQSFVLAALHFVQVHVLQHCWMVLTDRDLFLTDFSSGLKFSRKVPINLGTCVEPQVGNVLWFCSEAKISEKTTTSQCYQCGSLSGRV